MDHATGKHRGFGFVEYEEREDSAAAIDNMHNAELFGRMLKCNYAQPMKIKGGDKGWAHQPVWVSGAWAAHAQAASARTHTLGRTRAAAAPRSLQPPPCHRHAPTPTLHC